MERPLQIIRWVEVLRLAGFEADLYGRILEEVAVLEKAEREATLEEDQESWLVGMEQYSSLGEIVVK